MGLFDSKPAIKAGDMVYAWTTEDQIAQKAECGGAVTGLLKYALTNKMVDAVLAVQKGQDIYDAVPTVVTDPKELVGTAGSLHCGTLLIAKVVQKFQKGSPDKKLAVTVKGCDLMALHELAKRKGVNLSNLLLIGVNCGGTVLPVKARTMIRDVYQVDPNTVHKEEIDKGQFIIEYEGGHKGISIDDWKRAGMDAGPTAVGVSIKCLVRADLACGNWGVIGDKAGKAPSLRFAVIREQILYKKP
jgi:formate dehydrogenase subunit beta